MNGETTSGRTRSLHADGATVDPVDDGGWGVWGHPVERAAGGGAGRPPGPMALELAAVRTELERFEAAAGLAGRGADGAAPAVPPPVATAAVAWRHTMAPDCPSCRCWPAYGDPAHCACCGRALPTGRPRLLRLLGFGVRRR